MVTIQIPDKLDNHSQIPYQNMRLCLLHPIYVLIFRYDRNKLTQKDIHSCQYIAAMNPTAGSFTINPRLQRHFATFAVSFPSQDALYTIYNSILSDHLDSPANKFPFLLRKLSQNVVNATLALHLKCSQVSFSNILWYLYKS